MKKMYIAPEMETIEIVPAGMLCISTGIGDDATIPGQARFLDEDWDDFEE